MDAATGSVSNREGAGRVGCQCLEVVSKSARRGVPMPGSVARGGAGRPLLLVLRCRYAFLCLARLLASGLQRWVDGTVARGIFHCGGESRDRMVSGAAVFHICVRTETRRRRLRQCGPVFISKWTGRAFYESEEFL